MTAAPAAPQISAEAWDVPAPFVQAVTVLPEHVDGLGHCNNVQYVRWQEQVAWAHSEALGLRVEDYQRLGKAFAVHENRLTYERACFAGDQLLLGTWIASNDGRLRSERAFQFIRATDKVTVFRAKINFICIDLASGKPARMPPEFLIYQP